MAEAVFRARTEEAGLDGLVAVDSAGTGGWHEGDGADPRTVAVLRAAGYEEDHTARQFQADWFGSRDLVIALDDGHLRALRRLAPSAEDAAKVRLLRSYDAAVSSGGTDPYSFAPSHHLDVPDPYYGGMEGFEECLEMVEAACEGLLVAVRESLAQTGRLADREALSAGTASYGAGGSPAVTAASP
ncbi:low molecular weight protein-tyrosine-phosphatase [Streptomyces sp. NPDC018019]|uniref:low molecular weight protein-tyrosine-phosphatase n=1 Tax=Streptomyces sp. NPDC018019 TaxID=3365030 RepID=UPI0037AEA1F1